MLSWSLVSMIGMIFMHRNVNIIIKEKILESAIMTKIGTLVAAITVLVSYILRHEVVMVWILWLISGFAWPLLKSFLKLKRVETFRKDMISILDETQLLMSIGKSFRESLEQSSLRGSYYTRITLHEFSRVLRFSHQVVFPNFEQEVQELLRELLKVDRTLGKKIDHLKSIRYKLQIENYFRHKSSQVTSQIRTQSYIMSGLYFLLICFVLWNFELLSMIRFLGVSLALFTTGIIWIQKTGKKMKWMV